jgi:ribonuclease HI
MGGWGVVLIDEEGQRSSHKGCEAGATHNAMALRGAIEGLSKTEQGCEAKIISNNEYLVLGINDSRQRRANRELWSELEELLSRRHVQAEYIARHRWLGEAQILAKEATGG